VGQKRSKRRKVLNLKGQRVSLVVGKDMQVEQVAYLLGNALVGKFIGRRMSLDSLSRWTQLQWSTMLENGSIFHLLERGWIGFIFHSEVDTSEILKGQWLFDHSLLSLKP
jgi:hypothetical protein